MLNPSPITPTRCVTGSPFLHISVKHTEVIEMLSHVLEDARSKLATRSRRGD